MPAKRKSSSRKKVVEVQIPEKLYFRIGEVARLCRLPAYVLRFWETEFPHLKPVKSSTGQRMYRRREVECALKIRQLLYAEGYTIAGARERLKAEAKSNKTQSALPFPSVGNSDGLKRVKQGLQEILSMLDTKPHRSKAAKP